MIIMMLGWLLMVAGSDDTGEVADVHPVPDSTQKKQASTM